MSVSAGSLVELRVRGCAADVAKGSSGFLDSCPVTDRLASRSGVFGIPNRRRETLDSGGEVKLERDGDAQNERLAERKRVFP